MNWQPIETAPENEEFLAYDSVAKKMDVCHVLYVVSKSKIKLIAQIQMDNEYGPFSDEFGYDYANITHWMPLPEPPTN